MKLIKDYADWGTNALRPCEIWEVSTGHSDCKANARHPSIDAEAHQCQQVLSVGDTSPLGHALVLTLAAIDKLSLGNVPYVGHANSSSVSHP